VVRDSSSLKALGVTPASNRRFALAERDWIKKQVELVDQAARKAGFAPVPRCRAPVAPCHTGASARPPPATTSRTMLLLFQVASFQCLGDHMLGKLIELGRNPVAGSVTFGQ